MVTRTSVDRLSMAKTKREKSTRAEQIKNKHHDAEMDDGLHVSLLLPHSAFGLNYNNRCHTTDPFYPYPTMRMMGAEKNLTTECET